LEIIDIIKNRNLEKHFGGVYSKDQLPNELIKDKFYIVNLQDHDEGNGSHWVSFYYNYPSTSIYFDSYGFIAPRDVQKRITPYIFNDKDIQDFNSTIKFKKLVPEGYTYEIVDTRHLVECPDNVMFIVRK
jgi:hypothetical protein